MRMNLLCYCRLTTERNLCLGAQARKADATASEVMPNVETRTPGDPKLCSAGSTQAAEAMAHLQL